MELKDTMTIDGVTYRRERPAGANVIVIAANGWIFVGEAACDDGNGGNLVLQNASVVRKWTNGKGIGGLVKEANKPEYTLDPVGTITVHAPIATIECEW